MVNKDPIKNLEKNQIRLKSHLKGKVLRKEKEDDNLYVSIQNKLSFDIKISRFPHTQKWSLMANWHVDIFFWVIGDWTDRLAMCVVTELGLFFPEQDLSSFSSWSKHVCVELSITLRLTESEQTCNRAGVLFESIESADIGS